MDRRRRSTRIELPLEAMGKPVKRREKPRERWLLTRKTWKYMADAGRRLIPDGAQNRAEDLPRIEAYFQEVCSREPRFLLWRKSSYPGALPRPRKKKRTRGGSVRARSPSDDALPAQRPTDLYSHTSGGRFDMAKLKRDFMAAPPPPRHEPVAPPPPDPIEREETALLEMLRKYLKMEEDAGVGRASDADELVRSLRRLLARRGADDAADEARRHADPSEPDPGQRSLLDSLGRYYARSPNRDHIVHDLLTDRNLLKKLYHDLRKTRSYRGPPIAGGSGGGYGGTYGGSSGTWRVGLRTRIVEDGDDVDSRRSGEPPRSPPPLIEVRGESFEEKFTDRGTQTLPVPEEVLQEAERLYRERLEAATAPTSPTSPSPGEKPRPLRRSSVDHDDVSQSVSDTIKRYLRMARKKSVDADKADGFKRINYDQNLRNIKPRECGEFDDDEFNKGCQTVDEWMLNYKEMSPISVPSSPASPPSPASAAAHTSFLSTLLGRGSPGGSTTGAVSGGMQKSRSSSSVVQNVRRIWPTRSRSSSRVTTNWTPQGSCAWADGGGRAVRLADTSLLTLSDVERRALQQAALARLQQLKLGCSIKIPEENPAPLNSKPKRRSHLLKRKALTTGFFDGRPKEGSESTGPGTVFGVALSQCVESERERRRQQHGSRTSLASLGILERGGDDSESCDSGDWGGGSESRLQWSCVDEAAGTGGPRVPSIVSACLAHLRRHGLHTLGLFRVSSSKKRVRQLREEWERGAGAAGGGPEVTMDSTTCPHDVATLLKEFLRDLPDPLLCRDLYAAFLQTQKIRNRRLQWEAVQLVIQLLPPAHRDTLNAVLSFLAQLAAHSEDTKHTAGNKMDAANLATIFAPNILHRSKPGDQASAEQLSERADVINVVRLLIEKQAELWTLPAELLHEAYIHLSHSAPAHLDSLLLRRAECAAERVVPSEGDGEALGERRRMWSREECLHGGAATGGPDIDVHTRRSEKVVRSRRMRDIASSDTSTASSTRTIVHRVRSSMEECGSSGVVCSPPPSAPASAATSGTGRTDSAPDSADSASDYNETVGGSDDDSCVITASLHIPAAFGRESTSPREARRSPAAPPRRRKSTSGSESSNKRDSAVGSGTTPSSPASWASSPPSSPPPVTVTPVRVTFTSAGEIRRRRDASAARQATATTDIDRLLGINRDRNTSDARVAVLRQRDDTTTPTPATPTTTTTVTLYKRGELISSARQRQ